MESWINSDSKEGTSSGENEPTAHSDQEESGEDKSKHCSVHFFGDKQCRHKTDAMDTSAQMRVQVGTDECLRQLGHIRKYKIFLLLFTVTALLVVVHCCEKQNKLSCLKKLDSHSF